MLKNLRSLGINLFLLVFVATGVVAQPTANFSYSDICLGTNASFIDNSTGAIVSWYWTFGEGGTSTLQNPTYFYASPGAYSVNLVVTDTSAQVDSIQYFINVYDSPIINFTIVNETCGGSGDGSLTANVTGGAAPYTYNWTGGPTTQTYSNLYGGYYDLTVVDVNGCASTNGANVNSPYISPNYTNGMVSAPGNCDATSSVSPTGGNPPFTFLWTGGATTDTLYNMCEGNYYVTITDANGCTYEQFINVYAPPQNNFNVYNTCFGDSTQFYAYPADQGATQSVNWIFGDGGTASGEYVNHLYQDSITYNVTCVIIDTLGVADSLFQSIGIYYCPPPQNDFGWNNSCMQDSIQFYSYLLDYGNVTAVNWEFGDGNSSSGIYSTSNLYADTGMYNVLMIFTDTNSVVDTVVKQVYIYDCPPPQNDFWWNSGCLEDSIYFTANPADYNAIASYSWNFGDGSTSNLQYPLHMYADTGMYNVMCVFIDTVGNSDTLIKQIQVYSCNYIWYGNTCVNDSIQFYVNLANYQNVSQVEWLFGDGNTLIAGSQDYVVNSYTNTGSYNVQAVLTYTDLSVDTINLSFYVDQCGGGSQISWTSDCVNDSIYFSLPGADLSGLQSFMWYFGDGATSTDTVAMHVYSAIGNYEVKIVGYEYPDSLGNVQTDSLVSTIQIYNCGPTQITWDSNCLNDSITFSLPGADLSGLQSFVWSFGDGTTSADTMPKHKYAAIGTYEVKIVGYEYPDSLGNVQVDSLVSTIDVLNCGGTMFTLVSNTSSVLCNGGNNGTANITVAGGNSPYSFSWNNGATTSSVSGLSVGTYTVTIIDAFGQVSVTSTVITEPSVLMVDSVVTTNPTCFGSNNGTASATAIGGVAPYNFVWSNGRQGATLTGLVAKTYAVTAVDSNGCQSLPMSITLTQPSKLTVSSTATNANCGQADGSVTVVAAGGVSPYSYKWLDGSTANSLTAITSGGYGVTATDAAGCKSSSFAMVGDNNGPTVNILSVTDANCGGNDGKVFTMVTGGQQPYQYLWSNGVVKPNLLNAEAGEISVVVKDNNGCSGTAVATVGTQGTNPPSISGYVTTELSGFIVTSGKVSILIPNPYGGQFIKVGETELDANGFYSFDVISPIGKYTLYVEPDNSIPAYQNTVATYNGLSNKWGEAQIINTVCDSAFQQNIVVKELPPLNGSNNLGGTVSNDGSNKKYGSRAGDPIPGIDVALEQIPGGIIAFTQTDSTGTFSFPNVPVSDSSYTIYVDIPGLDMVNSYVVDLSSVSTDTVVSTLNFLVSDSTIYTDVQPSTSIVELNKENTIDLFVYPNPFNGSTNITYTIKESSKVKLEVYNLLGERVFIEEKGIAQVGTYVTTIGNTFNTEGVYILKLQVGDQIQTRRLVQVK